MANRINKNLRWVKRQCDLAKATDIQESEILDAMSMAELEFMERTGSVHQTEVITFDLTGPHATGLYTPGIGTNRIVYVAQPSNWSRVMVLTEDPKTYTDIKNANPGGTQPLVALVQNGLIQFWPVPVTGETITIYSQRTPKSDGSEAQVEGTGDPILSFHWDKALRYAALATLLGGEWIKRAEEEYNQQAHSSIQETGAPLLIDHSSRRLGF